MRFHVDHVRIQRTGVGNVHVAPTLKIGGNADFLHAFTSLRREPCLSQHVFAFNGDEACARIGRGNAHLDGVAGGVLLLVELEAQIALGKGFGGKCRRLGKPVASHRVGNDRQHGPVRLPHGEQKIARIRGG